MAKQRLDGLDAIKLIAAFFVVLQHSILRGTGKDSVAFFIYGACHFAVPTFFAVAGYIAGLKLPTSDLRAFAAGKAQRLLIPGVVWTVLFPIFTYARTGREPWTPLTAEWVIATFVGGGGAWFLIVLFMVSVLAAAADQKISKVWPAYVGAGLFVIIGLLQAKGPVGFGFGTFYIFILLYGAVYWLALQAARRSWRPSFAFATTVFLALTVGAGGLSVLRQTTGLQMYSWLMYAASSLAALAVLILAIDARLPWGQILKPMSWARDATLGIYVVHMVLISYVFMYLPRMQPLVRAILGALVTFLLTSVLVSLARRWKIARPVL